MSYNVIIVFNELSFYILNIPYTSFYLFIFLLYFLNYLLYFTLHFGLSLNYTFMLSLIEDKKCLHGKVVNREFIHKLSLKRFSTLRTLVSFILIEQFFHACCASVMTTRKNIGFMGLFLIQCITNLTMTNIKNILVHKIKTKCSFILIY